MNPETGRIYRGEDEINEARERGEPKGRIMDGLTEGRIVHYVMDDGRSAGEHRPAIVVRVWRLNGSAQANGLCQLQVFTDGSNDGGQYASGLFWATSVEFSEEPKPRTWHWIERA